MYILHTLAWEVKGFELGAARKKITTRLCA